MAVIQRQVQAYLRRCYIRHRRYRHVCVTGLVHVDEELVRRLAEAAEFEGSVGFVRGMCVAVLKGDENDGRSQ